MCMRLASGLRERPAYLKRTCSRTAAKAQVRGGAPKASKCQIPDPYYQVGTTPDLKSVQTGLEKKFPDRFVPDFRKNIFFAGRFVPGKINFFESVLTSNTKDHMEWYPLVHP